MIDQLYYYFIKTKYGKFTTSELKKFKLLHEQIIQVGLSIEALGGLKKEAIEQGVLGYVLTPEQRHVDNYILSNEFIVNCFYEDEMGLEKSMERMA